MVSQTSKFYNKNSLQAMRELPLPSGFAFLLHYIHIVPLRCKKQMAATTSIVIQVQKSPPSMSLRIT
jgi:hypothetical protein